VDDQNKTLTFLSVISTVFVLIAAVCLAIEAFNKPPPTAEEKVVAELCDRCNAMGGKSHYDESAQEFECWRHTFFLRTPKLLFKATYRSVEKLPTP
jgi:hypothetical protein